MTDEILAALERAAAHLESIAFETTDGMFDDMLADAALIRAHIETLRASKATKED